MRGKVIKKFGDWGSQVCEQSMCTKSFPSCSAQGKLSRARVASKGTTLPSYTELNVIVLLFPLSGCLCVLFIILNSSIFLVPFLNFQYSYQQEHALSLPSLLAWCPNISCWFLILDLQTKYPSQAPPSLPTKSKSQKCSISESKECHSRHPKMRTISIQITTLYLEHKSDILERIQQIFIKYPQMVSVLGTCLV